MASSGETPRKDYETSAAFLVPLGELDELWGRLPPEVVGGALLEMDRDRMSPTERHAFVLGIFRGRMVAEQDSGSPVSEAIAEIDDLRSRVDDAFSQPTTS